MRSPFAVAAAALIIAAAALPTTAAAAPIVEPNQEVIAFFKSSKPAPPNSKEIFNCLYAEVLKYPKDDDTCSVSRVSVRSTCEGATDSGVTDYCGGSVTFTTTEASLLKQVVDRLIDADSFREEILNYEPHGKGTIAIAEFKVAAITPPTPADPDDDKGFVAKYPFVIAAIAVALIIGVIIAAVVLIQKRANTLAEMDDESMLAEGEAPGFVPHANRASQRHKYNNNASSSQQKKGAYVPPRGGENEAVIITQGGRVITGVNTAGSYEPPRSAADATAAESATTDERTSSEAQRHYAAAEAAPPAAAATVEEPAASSAPPATAEPSPVVVAEEAAAQQSGGGDAFTGGADASAVAMEDPVNNEEEGQKSH